MLVSIIIITHNFEKYIEETLKSISNQSYKNIEIVVVDDKSTDNTFDIIKGYADKDKRIKFFQNKENLGRADSVNFALKKIKGNLIVIFDGDDIMPQERIEKQVEFMKKNPNTDMSYCNMVKFDEEGNEEFYEAVEFKENPLKRIKRKMNDESLRTDHSWRILDDTKYIPGTSAMIKKRVFEKGIKMDPKVWAATDLDLWLQIVGKGFKLKKADIIGLKYRIHQNQMSKNRDKNPEREYLFNKLKSRKYFK